MRQPFKRYSKVFLNLALAAGALLLCIFVVPKLVLFFLPFIIGWMIAAIANPPVRFFEEKFRIKRKAGSAFVIIAVIALILLGGYLLVSRLITAGVGFITMLPGLWETLEEDFREIGENLSVIYDSFPVDVKANIAKIGQEMDGYIAELVGTIGTPTVNAVGNFAKNIPGMVINVIMCILSAYFFIAEKEAIGQFWQRYIPGYFRDKWHLVFSSLKNAVGGYFKAQLKIELWMFLLLLIGFLLLRIPYAPLVAFLIAVLDFLPFFGTGAVMLPWAIIKFLSADYEMAIWLVVIWGVGQLARQIIQPKIVGDSVGIAPLPTLMLLFIGYKCAGVGGMILAIPIGIILMNMNQAGIFDTLKMSIRILGAGFNRFRRFDEEDKEILRDEER
ncbi:MAG: sporulation integral membrane protein YtvI [Lachnospiraceae bacterium]|nr:sporulation integral membrane protein YtvI [Lachnospiraceae bacterium]